MNRAELKALAKQQIKGNIGILFVIMLLVALITGAVGGIIPGVGAAAVTFVLAPAFSLSIYSIYLALAQGKKPEIKDMFGGFSDFWSAFKVTFLVGLFTSLWSLLFVIPGIVKACSYSQAMYILAENPKMSAREAINRSKEMMEGHKMDYFVLNLSFIGWAFLAPFTFGLLYIWLVPYMQATLTNFYNSVKPQVVVEGPEAPVYEPVAEPVLNGEAE